MLYAILVPILVNGVLYILIPDIFGTAQDTIYDTIFMMGIANLFIGIGLFMGIGSSESRLSPLQMISVLKMPIDDNAAFVMAKEALDKHHNITKPEQISIFKFPTLIRNFIFIGAGIIMIIIAVIFYI